MLNVRMMEFKTQANIKEHEWIHNGNEQTQQSLKLKRGKIVTYRRE